MSGPFTLRPARAGDAAAMMQVHRDAVLSKAADHYRQATLDAWGLGATADRVTRAGQQIADAEFIVLVADAAGDVIGYGVAVPSREKRAFATAAALSGDKADGYGAGSKVLPLS